jgi:hypothetical protein
MLLLKVYVSAISPPMPEDSNAYGDATVIDAAGA